MKEQDITSLRKRVDSLAREARYWRIIASAAFTGLVLIVGVGASIVRVGQVTDEVRARRFVLMDAEMRPRAVLGLMPDAAATLILTDAEGVPRVELRSDAAGASALHLYGTKRGVHAGLAPMNGSPFFELFGSDGSTVLSVPLR